MIGDQPDRIRNRCCWSCERWHSGHVWCPHCSAPVDPGSLEARMSPFWQRDPRRAAMQASTSNPATKEGLPVNPPNPWAAFTSNQRAELFIALDHRLAEAEAGNHWWDDVADMLASLARAQDAGETVLAELARRINALKDRV